MSDPIAQDLPDDKPMDLPEAVETLLTIPKQADDSREYLKQLHFENGYLAGTDAHILAALPVADNGEPMDYPAPKVHKTDAIRQNGDGESLKIVCTHSTDLSGTIEPVAAEENTNEFPDIQQVWPDTHENLQVRVNAEYLSRVLDVLTGDEDPPSVTISFVRADGDEASGLNDAAPIKLTSSRGIGLIMPLRKND